ncbi:unnamed protein product [Pleuronectes platessa]|uniref:Uncharacterized protein n=1 Tax=Pleuronectes platessa TaxID=8262 RepID=A0A9N7TWB5_PLEPL|nr:unnamed protein product [Pleuronectes platessa]
MKMCSNLDSKTLPSSSYPCCIGLHTCHQHKAGITQAFTSHLTAPPLEHQQGQDPSQAFHSQLCWLVLMVHSSKIQRQETIPRMWENKEIKINTQMRGEDANSTQKGPVSSQGSKSRASDSFVGTRMLERTRSERFEGRGEEVHYANVRSPPE